MNKKINFTIICYVLLASIFSATAQDTIVKNAAVQLKVRTQKNKILLRWAADKPTAWKYTNTYGYTIERFTIKRDDILLEKPEKVILTQTPLKPLPLAQWEATVGTNDYAAIVAQAIYGESFEVEGNQGELAQIVNKAKEIEQRFSFALFAADMDFEVAKMAGLGYEDTTTKLNEEYLYRVYSAVPKEIATIDFAKALVSLKDFNPLPAPMDLTGIFSDKSAILEWEYEKFKPIYNAYFVERSKDGKKFTRLNAQPLINMNDKPNKPAKRIYYIDSIAQNDKAYYYRVQGISAFGELGPHSKIVSGQGTPALPYTPHITKYGFDSDTQARILWEFPKEGEPLITSFELNWASKDAGPYKTVQTNIKPSQREVVYSGLKASNYFTITAVGRDKSKRTSYSTLIQPADSIPPSKPINLKGTIDSLGVVEITWDKNQETDLLGYRVFRGNIEHEEYVQITPDPIETNVFKDSVQLASLNSKVYYTVVAVDKRFNLSGYSEVLKLKKPDIVHPSSPIFKTYKIENEHVYLEWINSTSDDVALHKLFRKNISDTNDWQQVFETKDTTHVFIDTKTLLNKTYRYAIMAIDSSGLESNPTTPITVTVASLKPKEVIKSATYFVDRDNQFIEISWKVVSKQNNIYEFMIYKSKDENDPVLWKTVPVTITKLIDTQVTPSSMYKYHIRAVFKNGKYSKIKSLNIKY